MGQDRRGGGRSERVRMLLDGPEPGKAPGGRDVAVTQR